MAVISVVFAILLPALSSVRSTAKTVICSSNMKTLAMEFQFFATGEVATGKGDSAQLPVNRFWINDFQDSQYGLDEFWDAGEASVATLIATDKLVLCPAGAPQLIKRRGFPCGRKAIEPIRDVSVGFNMRLYRAVFDVKGKKLLASPLATRVSPRILDRSHVPLAMDVDGAQAEGRGLEPFYTAPPGAMDDPYARARYWFPARRHGGKTVVGFIGGHVLSSGDPASEKWDWTFQAQVGP